MRKYILKNPRSTEFAVPDGYITTAELAEYSGCAYSTIRYRCRVAGVPRKLITRVNKDGVQLGAHKLLVFSRREAMYAVLKD